MSIAGDRARIAVAAQLRTTLARLKRRRNQLQQELDHLDQIGSKSVIANKTTIIQPDNPPKDPEQLPNVDAKPSDNFTSNKIVPSSKNTVQSKKEFVEKDSIFVNKTVESESQPALPPITSNTRTVKRKRDQHICFSPLHALSQKHRNLDAIEDLLQQRESVRLRLQEFQASAGKRLNRKREPSRTKTHWDYLLEEMQWMANDFKQETMWKNSLAKKIARTVQRTLSKRRDDQHRQHRQEILRKRRMAAIVSKEISKYWCNIRKLVVCEAQVAIDARHKQSRSRHLQFLVDQTEQFSSMIADDLQRDASTVVPVDDTDKQDEVNSDEENEADSEVAGGEAILDANDADSSLAKDTALAFQADAKSHLGEASSAANHSQPTGNTLSTTKVKTPLPMLLRFGTLREYQHVGLDWLVSMYDHGLNVVLADEMGLGKTIMTIALLAYLAGERGEWGPHLIIVPTSVLINWEMEFKRWLPGFKIVAYYGNAKERREKRLGWSKPNAFHVVITSYKLAIADKHVLRRREWHYLILDEAQYIKNFRSQRWQTLISLRTKRRLLLTGTPLQNSLMELWSLMHFLMPHVFASKKEFQEWFADPVNHMLEGGHHTPQQQNIIPRLHKVLRPFLLRRLKKDVAEQLPAKHEHVVSCKLSRRQRRLYEDIVSSDNTQRILTTGSYISLMNLLMQLRKVCNHPNLFAERPVLSPLVLSPIRLRVPVIVQHALQYHPLQHVDPALLASLCLLHASQHHATSSIPPSSSCTLIHTGTKMFDKCIKALATRRLAPNSVFTENFAAQAAIQRSENEQRLTRIARNNVLRCQSPELSLPHVLQKISHSPSPPLVMSVMERSAQLESLLLRFVCGVDACVAPPPILEASTNAVRALREEKNLTHMCSLMSSPTLLHSVVNRRRLYFPDKFLVQYDSGKLQTLAVLLRRLRNDEHRVLLFTQMTRMLDVLEVFLNIYNYTYVRLDGTTRVEQRQRLMQQFNTTNKIFVFLLSTRSGGLGINLTGADTVIFYDTDWNPAMDLQAQDRCHRIGQTREVHIYRLVCRDTVEENILRKANQKRLLGDLVLRGGATGFNTHYFSTVNPRELLGITSTTNTTTSSVLPDTTSNTNTMHSSDTHEHNVRHQIQIAMARAEDESDRRAADVVMAEQRASLADFDEKMAIEAERTAFRCRVEATLLPVQVWSLRRLEEIAPAITDEHLAQLDTAINAHEQAARKEQQQHVQDTHTHRELSRENAARVAAGLSPLKNARHTMDASSLRTSPTSTHKQVTHEQASSTITTAAAAATSSSFASATSMSSSAATTANDMMCDVVDDDEDDVCMSTETKMHFDAAPKEEETCLVHVLKPTRARVLATTRYARVAVDEVDGAVLMFTLSSLPMMCNDDNTHIAHMHNDAIRAFASRHAFSFDPGDTSSACWALPCPSNTIISSASASSSASPSSSSSSLLSEVYVPRASQWDDDPNDTSLWGLFVTEDSLKRLLLRRKRKRIKRKPTKRLRPAKRRRNQCISIRIPRVSLTNYVTLRHKPLNTNTHTHTTTTPIFNRVPPSSSSATSLTSVATAAVATPAAVATAAAAATYARPLFPWQRAAHAASGSSSSSIAHSSSSSMVCVVGVNALLSSSWSDLEDALVLCGVALYGSNWHLVASVLYEDIVLRGRLRNALQCCERYASLLMRRDELALHGFQGLLGPKPPMPGGNNDTHIQRIIALCCLRYRVGHMEPMKLMEALQRLEHATTLNTQDARSCKHALRTSIVEGLPAEAAKRANAHPHHSHPAAIAEAHRRLNLPEATIRGTLSPRQIIELRSQRERTPAQHDEAHARMMSHMATQQQHERKQRTQLMQQQQQHQQRQMFLRQQHALMHSPHTHTTSVSTNLRGKTPAVTAPSSTTTTHNNTTHTTMTNAEMMSSSPRMTPMQRLQRAAELAEAAIAATACTHTPSSSSACNVSCDASTAPPVNCFVTFVLKQHPSLRPAVIDILQRKDLTQRQHIERIGQLFSEVCQRHTHTSPSSSPPSSSPAATATATAAVTSTNDCVSSLTTAATVPTNTAVATTTTTNINTIEAAKSSSSPS